MACAQRAQKKVVGMTTFCDPGGARTLDPMIKSHLLYQLSYGVALTRFFPRLRMQSYECFLN